MNAYPLSNALSALRVLFLTAALLPTGLLQARVLDSFDDNTKTAWTDFTFVPGLGIPSEVDGQFKFEMPPAGQSIFSASQKTSETFELKEGRTIEFQVDIIEGGAKDSFAILAFIPTSQSPLTLNGYGFAKSTTDILLTKGINKYFVADDGPAAHLKNDNITLVLRLTASNGNVIINAKALDKDADNAVIWEKTVIDTPEADALTDGTDDPKAPYITKGYFTLYLYQDFDKSAPENPYKVYYDNAEVYVTDTAVLDNFDDNTKTAWTDFTFVPGLGIPSEVDGQFKFEMPPADQSIFSASQKTSQPYELKEGEKVIFSVDLIEGGAKDSFAILAFIPTSQSPLTLNGYGFAKSTTDILLTKGINKYFVADDGPAAHLKNDNITLVLSLTVKSGSVIINAKALDKDADNAVIWERTVLDTPEADALTDGTDDPKAPYITKGYFTLYLYQDFDNSAPENPYKVYYDNAVVSAPPAEANVAPNIASETTPLSLANFLPATGNVAFTATDDKDLGNLFTITLNGVAYTPANGLTLSAAGKTRTATLGGKLGADVNYTAVFSVTDSEGLIATRTIYFDTFSSAAIVVETEDYNFDGGSYINHPTLVPQGTGPDSDSYSQQVGTQDIDFSETRTSPNGSSTKYRTSDPIRMQTSLDRMRQKFVDAGGVDSAIYDYDIGDVVAGEWLNYTRDFPSGAYEVYLRESLVNMSSGDSVLELVTGDATQIDQSVKTLGTFIGALTGFEYRNFPLADGGGLNKIRVNLSGVTTLRMRQITTDFPDGGRFQNYLVFVRVGDIELQPAVITSISPSPDSTLQSVDPAISVQIQNHETTVDASSIKLVLNGQTVTPVITSDAVGATVVYRLTTLPAAGTLNTAIVSFKDSQNKSFSTTWSFTLDYKSLNPANRVAGPGVAAGFQVHVVQAPPGSSLANNIQRAEDQLKANSQYERVVDVVEHADTINYDKKQEATVRGVFPDDVLVPGIDSIFGLDDFTVEMVAYLDLSAGVHRFGVISDDGYKLTSGTGLHDAATVPLAFHSGGPANETVDFVVSVAGLYPFRFVWYERGGDGYAEFFSVDRVTGERTLINDLNSAAVVKAYAELAAPAVVLQSSATLTGFADEPAGIVDTNAKTITLIAPGSTQFYRVVAPTALHIKSILTQGNKIVLSYE